LVAAIVIFLVGERPAPTPADTGAIDAATTELSTRLRDAASGASARATTLAELPRLGWAVATDAATVRDLTTEELSFQPRDGAMLPLGGMAVPEGAPRVERRLPGGAASLRLVAQAPAAVAPRMSLRGVAAAVALLSLLLALVLGRRPAAPAATRIDVTARM